MQAKKLELCMAANPVAMNRSLVAVLGCGVPLHCATCFYVNLIPNCCTFCRSEVYLKWALVDPIIPMGCLTALLPCSIIPGEVMLLIGLDKHATPLQLHGWDAFIQAMYWHKIGR